MTALNIGIKTKKAVPLTLAIAALLGSCRVPQQVAERKIAPIPLQYSGATTDTLNAAPLQFRDFFEDTNLLALTDRVLRHNLDYSIAGQQVKIAEAYLLSRKGALLPSISVGLRASGTHYGKHTMEGVGNFDTNLSPNIDDNQKINTRFTPDYWLGLNASWETDLWGKLRNMKKAARHRFLASMHGKHLLQSALVTQTAILYYELIALDQEINILEQHIGLQRKALETVSIQKEAGRATELAVQQFNAQLNNTEASLYEARQQVGATENQLHLLLGEYDGKIERSTSIDINGMGHLLRHGQPALLLQYRPDLLIAEEELAATHADARAARAAFFPTLSVSAFGAFNTFNGTTLFNPTSIAYQLLGGLVAPVFQQHQLKSNFRIANAQQEIAFFQYQKAVNHAYQEVKTLLNYSGNNQSIVASKNKEVAALAKGIEVSNDLYLTGYAGYLEIIAAQKSKLAADLELLQAKRNQARVWIQLYKSLGGGWQ